VGSHFCAGFGGIYGLFVASDDIFVKGVFHVRRAVLGIEKALAVRFVFGEEQFGLISAKQPPLAILPVLNFAAETAWNISGFANDGTAQVFAP
jgi:hypothetical protein